MPVIVSLLRGVNVGGAHQVKMDALRSLYESLGLRHVETFIQSGNIVFNTEARDLVRLARRIEDAIDKSFGFRCDVVLRTGAELRNALARNPFAEREGIDPAKVLIIFLAADPDPEGCAKVSRHGYRSRGIAHRWPRSVRLFRRGWHGPNCRGISSAKS